VLVAGYVQQQRRVGHDDVPEEPELVAVAQLLEEETDPDDLVVSDHSIIPFLAGRVVAGPLVDTATLRFETGSLTDAEVLLELERYDVRAVVVGRAFAARPQLLRELERLFPRQIEQRGLTVYLR
jgi:hypothetical protein